MFSRVNRVLISRAWILFSVSKWNSTHGVRERRRRGREEYWLKTAVECGILKKKSTTRRWALSRYHTSIRKQQKKRELNSPNGIGRRKEKSEDTRWRMRKKNRFGSGEKVSERECWKLILTCSQIQRWSENGQRKRQSYNLLLIQLFRNIFIVLSHTLFLPIVMLIIYRHRNFFLLHIYLIYVDVTQLTCVCWRVWADSLLSHKMSVPMVEDKIPASSRLCMSHYGQV